MEQLLLVNPRKRRKRKTPARGAGGRFLKRKAARKSAPRRRRRRSNPIAAANPVATYRRRRRSASRKTVRRRRRSNPISARGFLSQLTGALTPAIVGAGGAIAVDAAWRFIPLPLNLKSGYAGIAAKAVATVGIGMLLNRFVGGRIASQMVQGALAVQAYQVIKPLAASVAPNVLGYYGAGAVLNDTPSSLSLAGPVPDSLNEYLSGVGGVGEYLSDGDGQSAEW